MTSLSLLLRSRIIQLQNSLHCILLYIHCIVPALPQRIILYLYKSGCHTVRIGSPRPLSRMRVCPPLGTYGGSHTRLRVRGRGEPIWTTGEKARHSVYSVAVSLCPRRILCDNFTMLPLPCGCQAGGHKEMSSIFADQQRPCIRVQISGGGGSCGVSATEYSCAHHVTWSTNKLWRSTSLFNLCSQAIPNA